MAYPHGKTEHILLGTGTTARNLTAAANSEEVQWAPGYMPFLVRAVSIQSIATSALGAAGVVSFRDDSPFGSSTSTGNEFAAVTASTGATNLVYFRDDFTPRTISVGDRITAIITTGVTGESLICRVYGEWTWEHPLNATGAMVTG